MFLRSLPTITLSYENTNEKSLPASRFDSCSNMGLTIFSVVPGATVDSITTITPFFMCFPTSLLTSFKDS